MASLNKILLIGNLTRDPELRYTPQGRAVATLRLAANRNFRTKAGEDKKETCFINVVTWGNLAEVCNQYLQKGKSAFVEGRLQSRDWQDNQGNKRTTIEVIAERVQFLTPKGESQQQPPVDLGQEPRAEEPEFAGQESPEIES